MGHVRERAEVTTEALRAGTTDEIVEQPEQITMVVRAVDPMAEITDVFHRAFPALGAVAADQQSQLQSPAFALYHGAPGDTADLEVGFVTGAAVEPVGDVVVGFLPGGRIARTVYAGGYEGLGEAWAALFGWATPLLYWIGPQLLGQPPLRAYLLAEHTGWAT